VEVLKTLRGEIPKAAIWRKVLPAPDPVLPLSPGGTTVAERWDLVKIKVLSTKVFGADFSLLVDIAIAYEKSQQTKVNTFCSCGWIESNFCRSPYGPRLSSSYARPATFTTFSSTPQVPKFHTQTSSTPRSSSGKHSFVRGISFSNSHSPASVKTGSRPSCPSPSASAPW
jgi:hypothetical protein